MSTRRAAMSRICPSLVLLGTVLLGSGCGDYALTHVGDVRRRIKAHGRAVAENDWKKAASLRIRRRRGGPISAKIISTWVRAGFGKTGEIVLKAPFFVNGRPTHSCRDHRHSYQLLSQRNLCEHYFLPEATPDS